MNQFYNAMMSIFYEQLWKGVAHSEETVLTCCYNRIPDLFTISYGDYSSVCLNYHRPVESYHVIKHHFIHNAQRAGRHDLATQAALAVMDCVETGDLTIGEDEQSWLHNIIDGFFATATLH